MTHADPEDPTDYSKCKMSALHVPKAIQELQFPDWMSADISTGQGEFGVATHTLSISDIPTVTTTVGVKFPLEGT